MASRPSPVEFSESSGPSKPWSGSEFQDPSPTTANQENNPNHIQIPVLTEEERKIMKECERDSFYLRALPISIGTMTGAFFMVKNGHWTPHPRFGALPKMLIAGSISYFFGKLSYLPKCQQKILEKIPNSNLAATIRKSKGLPNPEAQVPAWEESATGSNKSSSNNEYRPTEGIDDRFRPSMDRDVKQPATPQQEKSISTYDELRRRNRLEYEESLSKRQEKQPGSSTPPYKESPFMPQNPWPEANDQTKSDSDAPPVQAPPKRKRTNMWGDVIEE
ncbi:unnamed protein product [Lymnaea stagnalis]|uniref:OCIA domain-containing protein n=1 Tax=Lymnaea stagnalis TaxID=6523 RepID=A0AAV2I919_LYMST